MGLRRLGDDVVRLLRPFPWSCRLGVLCAVFAGVGINLGAFGYRWLIQAAELAPEHLKLLADSASPAECRRLLLLIGVVGGMSLAAALLAFVRVRLVLAWLKVTGAAIAAVWMWLLALALRVPSELFHADRMVFDESSRNDLWLHAGAAWLPGAGLILLFLLCLVLQDVHDFYGSRRRGPLLGDKIIDDLRTHGGDARFRTSWYWAGFLHLFFIFLLPFMLRGCMEDPYGIPKGSGEQIVQVVKVKKVKKKKEDKMVLNMNSAILFYRPELDDRILEEVQEETLDTYVATSLKDKLGKGGKGKGGWPNGMANALVRFIRLEYGGGDWDQQMGKGADYNFLIEFSRLTGFKIADSTEHIPIHKLRRFPKDRGPPFVFITGSGRISVNAADAKTLRWYCTKEGGMIFADNGGGSFNSSFRSLMRRVFPELEWVDIASDDPIYRKPYLFPRGAPPLWHHSGTRAVGLKHNGRWVVFYHQGDLNDAWQTGHSGVSKHVASQAYKMGVNVVNYAFNQYYSLHYEQ